MFHSTVFAIWTLHAEIHRRREGHLVIAQKNTGPHTPTGITYSQALCVFKQVCVSWGGNHRWCHTRQQKTKKTTTLIHHMVKSIAFGVTKGAVCSFGQAIWMFCNINEVMNVLEVFICFHNWIRKLFLRGKIRTLFMLPSECGNRASVLCIAVRVRVSDVEGRLLWLLMHRRMSYQRRSRGRPASVWVAEGGNGACLSDGVHSVIVW